jgi:substrate import-associated zinc metallohydrolase lipoprotein
MKRKLYMILFVLTAVFSASCEKDEPSDKSIFDDTEVEAPTAFDLWLQRNYVEPYNIRLEYRMPYRETNLNYWVSPPTVSKSIQVAKVIRYTILEAMTETMSTGKEDEDPTVFVKKYFPKVIFLVGSYEISNTGTVVLGSAENGLQINILGVNSFEPEEDATQIAGTMIHEFMHILDGTVPVPNEYDEVTASDYVGSTWTSQGSDYLQKGFVSNYGRCSVGEDIAEVGCNLIVTPEETWESWYEQAGEDGAAKLKKKHDIIVNWLWDSFGVNSSKWASIYQERIANLDEIDYDTLED